MRYSLRLRISDYRNDPYFPTMLPLALVLGLRDWVWYRADGQPRWYKPSLWPNVISDRLNRSLFDPSNPIGRKLKVWERVLLSLGF